MNSLLSSSAYVMPCAASGIGTSLCPSILQHTRMWRVAGWGVAQAHRLSTKARRRHGAVVLCAHMLKSVCSLSLALTPFTGCARTWNIQSRTAATLLRGRNSMKPRQNLRSNTAELR